MDKIMRMHSVSSTIENGFVYIPTQAEWLPGYLHEISAFPKGKYDDRVDATSQALDWSKQGMWDSDCSTRSARNIQIYQGVKRPLFVKKHDQATLTSRV